MSDILSDIRNSLSTYLAGLEGLAKTLKPFDALDVLIVAFLIYHAIRLLRETRGMQLAKGITIILVMYLLAVNLKLITLTFIITNVLQWGIVALAIVFQPELRRALEQVGRSKISNITLFGAENDMDKSAQIQKVIDSVCTAATELSASKTGALIVLEREIRLGDVISTGTVIDAEPTTELICNIFFPNSPMHDGAMVVRSGRLCAAGCFLPLSANDEIGRELGTRHRAALGMSEVSDAVVVVVSEETGAISVAQEGKLQRKLSTQNLVKLLSVKMAGAALEKSDKDKKQAFWRKSK